MTPDFEVILAGVGLLGGLKDRIISIEVRDDDGFESDMCTITLDDRGGLLALPPKGAVLTVAMGYKETGVFPMGQFTVITKTPSFSPETLVITARSADFRESLKETRSENFDDKTLGEILETIAGRNNLELKISDDLKDIMIEYIAMTDESDLNFVTRLAKKFGAVGKFAGGKLIFLLRGEMAALMPTIFLTRSDMSQMSCKIGDREEYSKIVATWHKKGSSKAEEVEVETGLDGPIKKIRVSSNTEVEAKAEAEAKAQEMIRRSRTLNGTVGGNPMIMAEAALTCLDVRIGVDGAWRFRSVTHTMNKKSGYVTSFTADKGDLT